MTTEEIHLLTKKIRNSDTLAFRTLFDFFHRPLYHFVFYKTYNRALSEDIVQDVFIRLWENRINLREDLSIKSYLYTIAVNLTLNSIRRHTIRTGEGIEDPDTQPHEETPLSVLEKKEFEQLLNAAIQKLPEQARIVFMMSRYDDLSYSEISERLSISVKTVEAHIGRALKQLRATLKP
ncbi:RNA polymerase sigma-70 factor [bacterium]|nr:RNA polymerase sigma-70 factor [bacterium]NUN44961.1 RNA polymerase sigma-70 factor [bacterium]